MQTDLDLLIIGGGCAGLSLALRLAELGSAAPKTAVLESRTHYRNDRTWCFWSETNAIFPELVRRSWKKIAIQAGSERVLSDCLATPYQMIPAGDFYSFAQERISNCSSMELCTNAVLLGEPVKVGDRWQLETTSRFYRGRVVIDTRPLEAPKAGGAVLWQSFLGQEIECDSAVFDPDTVELMDFSQAESYHAAANSLCGPVIFTYVLPFASHRALIEATVFSPDPNPHGLQAALDAAVFRYTSGAKHRILRSESGVLPMGAAAQAPGKDATYVRAGLGFGGARASTGYAFQRIQSWADLCFRRIAAGLLPIGHPADPPLLRAMDQIFLSVLRAQPQSAPALFLSLFRKTETARIIRFLSDRGTLLDYAAIVAALPFLPFIKQAPATLFDMAQHPRPVCIR